MLRITIGKRYRLRVPRLTALSPTLLRIFWACRGRLGTDVPTFSSLVLSYALNTQIITLEPYNVCHSRNLSALLCADIMLKNELGVTFDGTPQDFHQETLDWTTDTSSASFAIIYSRSAVGLISLLHIDLEKHTARVGYWLASRYWSQGFYDLSL